MSLVFVIVDLWEDHRFRGKKTGVIQKFYEGRLFPQHPSLCVSVCFIP
jgi:hypothetical protein